MFGFGPMELGIILAIALVIFGGAKLRSLGGDVGGAIKEFKHSLKDGEEADEGASASRSTVTDEKKAEPAAASPSDEKVTAE